MAQSISQESISVTGLPGTTSGARLVGGTASGAPVSGTFAVGDLSVDQTGLTWVCVSSGSPGTWKTTTPASQTSITMNTPVFVSPTETANIVASAATGTVNIDVVTSSLWQYTTAATGNFTLNIRGNGSTTLNSILSVGQSVTVAFLNTNGTSAYYLAGLQIDGNVATLQWQGGNGPISGNASATDSYTFLILKTATNTYTVLASLTKFQ